MFRVQNTGGSFVFQLQQGSMLCVVVEPLEPWHSNCALEHTMAIEGKISGRSWSGFAISAAVLLLFAFLSVRHIRDTLASAGSAAAVQENTTTETPPPETEIPEEKTLDQITEGAPQQREADETAPEKKEKGPELTVNDLVQAWNKGDPERVAGLFLPNGVLRLPTGSEIQSRDEIKKAFAEQRSGRLRDTTLTNTVDEVSTPNPESAVVKGTYQIDGLRILGFSASTTGTYRIQHAKRDGRWLIAKAELTRK